MNKLERLRASAGIEFTKSFGCIEAEKNIHLLDRDQFFKKFLEKLEKMGYKPLKDFEHNVIRLFYPYAERHHIGKTYEWKYFYSTTFTIEQSLIDYLLYHRYIQPINAPKENNSKPKQTWEDVLELNEAKLKNYKKKLAEFKERGADVSIANYEKAIENCKLRIENIKKIIEQKETTTNEQH